MYEQSPIPIDQDCRACSLGSGAAVAGNGPSDLTKVKLILISDYPGPYEAEFGWPQVPNSWVAAQRQRKPKLTPRPNSGLFIRDILTDHFGLDPVTQVWITNGFKCDPKGNSPNLKPTDSTLRSCATRWLISEFYQLDQVVPTVPILACGSWALKALQFVYGSSAPDAKVEALLRVKDIYAGSHPLVCSYNPATYARSFAYLESSVGFNRRTQSAEIKAVTPLNHYLYTTTEVFLADLSLLKQYIEN